MLALAGVELLIGDPEDLRELRGIEKLREVSSPARNGVVKDDIVVELPRGLVELEVLPHRNMLGIAAEIILQAQVEPSLEHGRGRVRIDLLHGKKDLDGLGVELPREKGLLEILVRLVGIQLVLVLAVGVVERLLLLLLGLYLHESGIGDGLPTVAAGDEAVHGDLVPADIRVVCVHDGGLPEVGLEDGYALHELDAERDVLHSV